MADAHSIELPEPTSVNKKFAISLARAAGGSLIFSLPMLMTMEMWWLGFTMTPFRSAMLLGFTLPVLVGLAYYSGFEQPVDLRGAIVDAFVAFAIGCITATIVLALFAVLNLGEMSVSEFIGVISLLAIPGSFGAVFASSQLITPNSSDEPVDNQQPFTAHRTFGGYLRELFLMLAGALFLAFNVAPTEEMILIAYKMTGYHAMSLAVASLLIMHAFVYVVEFRGQEAVPSVHPWWSVFLRFTIPGYAIALLVSLFCLWAFGRVDQTATEGVTTTMIVLGFPSAVGAAAARLIL